jgi:hypothetical protein
VLNPANGAVVSTVGPLQDSLGRSYGLTGLAFNPITGVLYGSTSNGSPTAPGSLVTVNPATVRVTVIGGFSVPNSTMADLTFAPNGTLFGWESAGTHHLASVNLTTGAATLIGPGLGAGLFGGEGLAARADGTLFSTPDGNSGPGTLRTVNATTGLSTIVGSLTGLPAGFLAINSMDFDSSGGLFGILTNSGLPASTRLVTINQTTGAVTVLGTTPNDLDTFAIQHTAAVPAPPGVVLLGIGCLCLARSWWRRPPGT